MVGSRMDELSGLGTPVGAILIESAMLPVLSDVLRRAYRLPVVDNYTLSDLVHAASTDNPRFGVSFGPNNASTRTTVDTATAPAIGILRIDYSYPPALGDAAHPGSYGYRTPHATCRGLTFEAAQRGDALTDEQREAMRTAVAELEATPHVVGIAGDCGFMMSYLDDARRLCSMPCFISALLQCSMLSKLFAVDELILVLTASGASLTPHMPKLLSLCHVTAPEQQARFIVAGCETLPGFDAVARGERVDVEKVSPHIVELVMGKLAAMPKIRAVLLECTELPPYADAIRKATGLPVLDAITLVDYYHGAISDEPYNGIDWHELANTPSVGPENA